LLVEATERNVDHALLRRRPALDDGPISLADLAVLEQQSERSGRLAMPAEHEAAGRIAVEPMRQYWRPWQPKAQRLQTVLQRHAALVTAVPWAAMHGDAGRLVDDQHQAITMQHA